MLEPRQHCSACGPAGTIIASRLYMFIGGALSNYMTRTYYEDIDGQNRLMLMVGA